MDIARRLEIVEAENALLRERVLQLEAERGGERLLPLEWRLTATEGAVMRVLIQRETASKDQILEGVYGNRPCADEVPEPKIVDVFVCKLRKKLRPFGIEILTHWGRGYLLPPATRAALAGGAAEIVSAPAPEPLPLSA